MTNIEHEDDVVELASSVDSYQRRTKSGQVITVRAYTRTDNSALADRAKASPGRPSTAASGGVFPGGRSLPMFPDAGKVFTRNDDTSDKVEYEGLEDTGVVDQAVLDKEVPIALEILPNLPQNPSMKKLISILRGLSDVKLTNDPTFDPTIIELARQGVVKVSGYSYVSKKTGKLVRVNPYTQMRALVSALGGPTMAARKGVTPDLIDSAMPGFDMKKKGFKTKTPGAKAVRASKAVSKADVARQINEMHIDRSFDIPAPKAGDDYLTKAMSATHPLAAVRNAREGSVVTRGNDSWVRGMDSKWYKTPRKTTNGITDRELTKRIASKGGRVDLVQGNPIQRKDFESSKVDFDSINPRSVNYASSVRYHKSLEPSFRNMPEGVADSLNGHVEVRREAGDKDKDYTRMIHTTSTRANNHYPKLVVNPNPEFEKDLIKALPKQQEAGFSSKSTLHPLETAMTRETASFTEKLFETRAPSDMVDRMYERMNKAYDKHIKSDGGDYSGLRGRDGWVARLTGDRSEELSKEIRDKLSMSALDSPEDFLAESWTEFVGNPSPRDLPRDIANEFQATMVEFSDYLFKNGWVDATEIPEKTYERSTKKSVSRKVSDAIGGSSESITEEVLAPRDLRSVLRSSSKYLDIRDEDYNPLFDARVRVDGDTANIASLSYPLTNPSTQPNGIPNIDTDLVVTPEGATYFHTPGDLLASGEANQKRYSDFIDQKKALLAIEAIEENLFSEGVRRFEIDTKPREDSILYARAGYLFDPNDTDVDEIYTILNDVRDSISSLGQTNSAGHYAIPKSVQRSIMTKVNKWDKNLTADPETWPTPQDIAQLGKTSLTSRSVGESALDAHAWSGVKTLSGKNYPKAPDIPDSGSYENILTHSYKDSNVPGKRNASAVANLARAVTPEDAKKTDPNVMATVNNPKPTSSDVKTPTAQDSTRGATPTTPSTPSKGSEARDEKFRRAMFDLADDVIGRHSDQFDGSSISVTGSADDSSVVIKDKSGTPVFTLNLSKNVDGDMIWDGPHVFDYNAHTAFLAWDMADEIESSYMMSGNKVVWKSPRKEDQIAAYALAYSGYTWSNPPTKEKLAEVLTDIRNEHVKSARNVFSLEATAKTKDGSIEDMVKAQGAVDKKVDAYAANLDSQIGAYLNIVDSDPSGLSPFEVARFGMKEARELRKSKDLALSKSGDTKTQRTSALPPVSNGQSAGSSTKKTTRSNLPPVGKNTGSNASGGVGTGLPPTGGDGNDPDGKPHKQPTAIQQMTSIDGDPLNDSFVEFTAKQLVTLGGYGWYKSLGGYWDWITDTYNPTARKASVSFLFMLIRLMPASVFRGAMLSTVNTMVKKIKSSDPEDWPSPQELAVVVKQLQQHIPQSQLDQLNGAKP